MKSRYVAYAGLALLLLGAVLLLVCYVAGWQSNVELLTGLAMVVGGVLLHVRLQHADSRY